MAFLQPQAPRQPVFNAPAVVLGLIALLAAIHAGRGLVAPEQDVAWMIQYGFIPARYSPAFLAAAGMSAGSLWDQVVPFFSYMALHGGWAHLAINGAWLLAFGPVVARRFGTGLFLLFFILCGLAGAAAHLAINWGSAVPMIGASGAISGLMAAAVRMLPTLRPGAEGPLVPVFSRQILMFTLVWLGVNALVGITGLGLTNDTDTIAWQAHVGGFVAGLFLAGPFDRLRPPPVGVALD